MATTSYGKITIIDVTDVGNFSVYPYANGPNTQIYSEENSTYYPDWGAQDSNNNYISPLILTPVVTYAGQDKTTQSTVNWYLKTDLVHPITDGFNSTTKTLTVHTNISTANTYVVYVVKAHYISETGAEVNAEGEITFSLLTQPSSIKNVSISGSNVIKYASDSTVPAPSSVTLVATLTGGNNIVGDGWKYWDGDSWENASGVSGLTVNNLQLTVNASYNNSAVYFNADIARFKYVAHASADVTDIYEDIFTVFQLRDGASGSSLITIDLTNDSQLVPLNSENEAQWDAIGDLASTTIYVYRSGDNITSENPIKATLTNISDIELYSGSTKYTGNWSSGQDLPSNYYTIKVTGFTSGATSGSILFETTVYSYNPTEDTSVQSGTTYYTKNNNGIYSAVVGPTGNPATQNYYIRGSGQPYTAIFSLVGAEAGLDGRTPTIYTLDFPSGIPAYVNNPIGSASSGTLIDNWSYSPSNLVIKAYEITTDLNGVSSRTPYSGRIWYKPNISNGTVQTGANEWGSIALSSGEASLTASSKLLVQYSPYTFRLVGPSQSNIAANIKDEESINILSDGNIGNAGNDGNDAINLLINNENVTLNATSDGKTRSTTITCGYQGYIGATENSEFTYDSYSSSKVGLVSSVTTTTNSGKTYVNIIIPSNVSVSDGDTGTITLNFKYKAGTANEVSLSKIISWIAKLDAVDGAPGADAIVLTWELGGNKTTYFKNETGTTKVTPVLMQNGTNLLSEKTAGTDYLVSWTDLVNNGNTVTLDSDNCTAVISATNIQGVGSYSCTITYPKTNGKNYTQYISFTDYSDPLQVELISTIGDKLTNGIGEGVVYPQTTRDNTVLDQVATNTKVVYGYASAPSNPADGDFYFNTGNSTLYERVSGAWTTRSNYAQIIVLRTENNVNPIEIRNLSTSTYSNIANFSNLTYVWSFRDQDGNVINPNTLTDLKVSHKDASHSAEFTTTNVTGGQFIYVNKNVVNNKLVILCQVTSG